MEYSLELGKYFHEVVNEATPEDIAMYGAIRKLRAKAEQEEARRQKVRSQVPQRSGKKRR